MTISRSVLVVEDEALIRNLVAAQLKAEGFEVYTAASAAEARKVADSAEPDVALLDIELGFGPTGIDLATILRRQDPGIAIVFLTHLPEPKLVGIDNRMIPKNAAYLVKERITDPGQLTLAIEAALRDRVTDELRAFKKASSKFSNVSRSQLQVIQAIASGASNHDIAEQRGTTIRAVENLIKRAFESAGLLTDDYSDNRVHLRVAAAKEYLRAIGKLRDN